MLVFQWWGKTTTAKPLNGAHQTAKIQRNEIKNDDFVCIKRNDAN